MEKELEYWANKWDDALNQGIFDDADKGPVPSHQTGSTSFFGVHSTNPTGEVNDVDAQYWKSIYAASGDSPNVVDPLDAADLLNEITTKGSEKKDVDDVRKDVAQSPNPIEIGTTGKDQNLDSKALGHTFHEKDVEDLASLKLKLHQVEDQINDIEGRGKSSEKVSKRLAELHKEIDELSDTMTRTYPLSIVPK